MKIRKLNYQKQDRDLNAFNNILKEGINLLNSTVGITESYACGGKDLYLKLISSKSFPVNQESMSFRAGSSK